MNVKMEQIGRVCPILSAKVTLIEFFIFSQSQQSLTKYNLFCFKSPKLSLSFFNCSCSPMNVKMEQIGRVGPILGANVTLIEFFTR